MLRPAWADRPVSLPVLAVDRSAWLRFWAASAVILLLPFIFQNDYFISVMQGIAITYIVVLGLNVLMGFSGQSSFGHAGFVAIGAYTSVVLEKRAGIPFWIMVVAAPLVTAAFGVLLALPALRARGPFLVMITAAFGLAVQSVVSTWLPVTGGPMGISGIPRPAIFDIRLDNRSYFYLVAFSALTAHALMSNLLGARWGRTWKAVRDAPLAAATLGIDVNRWKTAAFGLSAFLAGLAGVYLGHRTPFLNSDSFTVADSLSYILAVVFGGIGTIYGPFVGTVILALLPQVFAPVHDYLQFILGALLIFVLLVMPAGIVGTLELAPFLRRRQGRGVQTPAAIDWTPSLKTGASSGSALLDCRRLLRLFGGLRAVDEVDLSIEQRTIHGLIGPNGSGKSTLVNIVSGVYLPSGGTVLLDGHDLGRRSAQSIARLGVTRTFQTPQLFRDLNVIENVMVGFHLGLTQGFWQHLFRTRTAVAEEQQCAALSVGLLRYFDLSERSLESATSLPYGYQKLLEIARGLATGPRLLILDEPAGGATQTEIGRAVEVLRRLRAAGVTVLVIEHHMDLITALCDRVTVLDFGKKIAEASPAEVLRDSKVIEAYLGAPADAGIERYAAP